MTDMWITSAVKMRSCRRPDACADVTVDTTKAP